MTKEELRVYTEARGITPEVQKIYSKYIDTTPFVDKGIAALDATTVLSGRVNVMVIRETEK